MAYVTTPVILDKSLLENGLHTLIQNFAEGLSTEFSIPMLPPPSIQALTSSLSTYLGYFVQHNLRRSEKPLRPANLECHILRSRNPAEETKDEEGNYIKGEKRWHRLVLFETTKDKDVDVQILVDGKMSLNKAEVLEGFKEGIKERVEAWKAVERERDRKFRMERAERRKMAGKEKDKMKKKQKGKGRETLEENTKDEEQSIDLDDEAAAFDDLDHESASDPEEDLFLPNANVSQRRRKRKLRASTFEDMDDEWTMIQEDDFDAMTYKAKRPQDRRKARKSVSYSQGESKNGQVTVVKKNKPPVASEPEEDVYGYDSESGECEGSISGREEDGA